MLDAVLIHQRADPSLRRAIVEQFIAMAGSRDPLAIPARSGNRVVLVPKPTTPEEALALIRDELGRHTVRVGITQYPASVGLVEAVQLKPEIVEPSECPYGDAALCQGFSHCSEIISQFDGERGPKTGYQVKLEIFFSFTV